MADGVRKIWSRDWFAALAFCSAFLILAYAVAPDRVESLEHALYDRGVSANPRPALNRVVIVAIDERSLADIGPYPWPRALHAQLLDRLKAAGAAQVSSTIFFSGPRDEPAVAALEELAGYLASSPLTQAMPAELEALHAQIAAVDTLRRQLEEDARATRSAQAAARAANPRAAPLPLPAPRDLHELDELSQHWQASALATQYRAEIAALQDRVQNALGRLSADDSLARAMQDHGASLLPVRFTPGTEAATPAPPAPDYLRRFALADAQALQRADASAARPPTLHAIEHLPPPDLGAAASGIGPLRFVPDADGVLRREMLVVPLDTQLYPSLSLLTAAHALQLKPQQLELRPGQGLRLGARELETSPSLELRTHFYRPVEGRSPFAVYSFVDVLRGKLAAQTFKGKIVLIGATAAGLEPGLNTPLGIVMAPVTVLAHSVSGLLQAHYFVEPRWAAWLGLLLLPCVVAYLAFGLPQLGTAPGLAVSAGLIAILLLTEFYLLANSALWVRLGLPASLLLFGQLFMSARALRLPASFPSGHALETAPPQPVAAAAEHSLSDTLLLDGSHGAAAQGRAPTGPGTGTPQRRVLGRYPVEKELGQGAMGVVYLGHDPKIGRRVAIKTLALSGDFAADERSEVKARFFREAEAAGSLSHPHIVQIFDAGEDHDLAFIAMEYIQGHDLVRYTKPQALLPVAETLKYIADAADALDYAHQRNIVHRDIKPANLMLVADTKTIKVMDFGIARITDSSKTRTGMVLGTPSYMSPEQLSGKRVDGRSDLFSLGVTAYQLLTGTLPFQAESIATLMFKISNEPHPPLTAIRPDLPPALNAVIDRALNKRYEARFQRGSDFAQALRAVLATLS